MEGYEPTPPKISDLKMDVKGTVQIQMSELLFEIDDIKGKNITIDLNSLDG